MTLVLWATQVPLEQQDLREQLVHRATPDYKASRAHKEILDPSEPQELPDHKASRDYKEPQAHRVCKAYKVYKELLADKV